MKTFSYQFPPHHEELLSNGLRLIVVPQREQQGVILALQLPTGRYSDTPGSEGTAEITSSLMTKGPRSLSTDSFLERIERTGTAMSGDVGDEYMIFSCRFLASDSDEIIPLFWDSMCSPALPQTEFARIKKEMITSLQTESSEPGLLSHKHFYAHLCGPGHPAGRQHTITAVKSISYEKICSFYQRHIYPQGSTVVIAGDIEPSQVVAKWRPLFERWSVADHAESVTALAVAVAPSTTVRLIDKADMSQTTLALGFPMPGELSPDHQALSLANYILGAGNFSSRLMEQVRTKLGKTYGISSQISSERLFGAFSISTSTQTTQLDVVLATIFEVYTKFVTDGITDAELEAAKKFSLGNLAFQLEGIANIADKLLWLRYYDRPNTYIEYFGDTLSKISTADVNDAIRRNFVQNRWVIIAVGKKQEILGSLQKFGPVEIFKTRQDP